MKERVSLIGGKIEVCSIPGWERGSISGYHSWKRRLNMHKKKVLIADDHALVREGIVAFLKLCDDIEVVAEASDGLEAIEKTNKYRPDIIIMDINMPKLGGLETTVEIKKLYPHIKVLVLTQYEDREYISRFLKAGVSRLSAEKSGGERSDHGVQDDRAGRALTSILR